MPRNVIIDCDTGLDDALALLLALRSPEFNVLGITCVNGNVSLDKVVANTLKVVSHSGRVVPVYAGAESALMPNSQEDAAYVHGNDGLGGIRFPQTELQVQGEHAVDFTVRTLMQAEQPVDWITLGPLTNAALALCREPRIAGKVRMLTMMAGGLDCGNTTPAAEFNVYADPEAARIVFDSPIKKTMVPLDPLRQGGHLSDAEIHCIAAAGHLPWCDMASRIFKRILQLMKELNRKPVHAEGSVSPPDLLTMAVAIDPGIARMEEYTVFVETSGEYTRGMTVVDRRLNREPQSVLQRDALQVCISVDHERYAKCVLDIWLNESHHR